MIVENYLTQKRIQKRCELLTKEYSKFKNVKMLSNNFNSKKAWKKL